MPLAAPAGSAEALDDKGKSPKKSQILAEAFQVASLANSVDEFYLGADINNLDLRINKEISDAGSKTEQINQARDFLVKVLLHPKNGPSQIKNLIFQLAKSRPQLKIDLQTGELPNELVGTVFKQVLELAKDDQLHDVLERFHLSFGVNEKNKSILNEFKAACHRLSAQQLNLMQVAFQNKPGLVEIINEVFKMREAEKSLELKRAEKDLVTKTRERVEGVEHKGWFARLRQRIFSVLRRRKETNDVSGGVLAGTTG